MFVDNGPGAAIDLIKGYVIANAADLPAEAAPKLVKIAMERSAIIGLIDGHETLYSAMLQCPGMPNEADAWLAVGAGAFQVANSNLLDRGARSFEIMTYANFKVNGAVEGMDPPPVPSLDDQYRVIPLPPELVEVPPEPDPDPSPPG